MDDIKFLVRGLKVSDTRGSAYVIVDGNEIDTILENESKGESYVVAIDMDIKMKKSISRFIGGGIYVIPKVIWDKAYEYTSIDEAIKFMQDRYMDRTGKKQCNHLGCDGCQYMYECFADDV